jgi:hypothetical protein
MLKHLIKTANSSYTQKIPPKTIQRTLLLSEESYATPLFLIVMDLYGPEALEWSPETIRLELEQDFQLKLPKITIDKIFAAISIVTTNYFYKDVKKFIDLCNILAGDDFQPDEFDPADAEEMLLGITEALLLWPPDEDPEDTEFSLEIREYISQVLNTQGILKPFDVLNLAFSGDQSGKVNLEFADDPEMYSAIYKNQEEKTNELKQIYLENMFNLAEQLKALPLKNGNTQELVTRLEQIVQIT